MLRALRHLDLRMNKLTRLPEELGYLAALEHLDVANNELCELPTSIGRCKRLSLLDLSANRLRQLPSSLGQLNTTLRTLWTADNPWESPLKEILPSAYLVPVAKRNSRADLPSKLVKKGRRVSASAASVLLMDGDEPVRSAECAVDEEGARDRTRSECALDDEEARDRVRSRPYGSSHISSDSAFGGEETEDVPSSTLSTSPQRFSKLPFFRSQSIPNQSSSSSISTSPIAAFHSDAGPPGDPRPASLPATSTSQSPMANSPPIPPPRAIKMNACGLDFVLAYLRDLHDLDPSTREYPTAACEAIVVPELASLSTSPTASNGEITSGADANAATTVAACPLPPVPVVNRRKMLDRRRKIIEEIVKTEASYVQYLATVSEVA